MMAMVRWLGPGADGESMSAQVKEAENENLATLVWKAGIDSEPALPPVFNAQRVQ